MIDKIRAYFSRHVAAEPSALTSDMDTLLRFIAIEGVVRADDLPESCRFNYPQATELTREAVALGYLVTEQLRTDCDIGDSRSIALTALGYSLIGMTPPRRMKGMLAEHVRLQLHRLIPNSQLQPNLDVPAGGKQPDLLVHIDRNVHQPLLAAVRAQAWRKHDRSYVIPDGALLAIECEPDVYPNDDEIDILPFEYVEPLILQGLAVPNYAFPQVPYVLLAVAPKLFQRVKTGKYQRLIDGKGEDGAFIVDAYKLIDDLEWGRTNG